MRRMFVSFVLLAGTAALPAHIQAQTIQPEQVSVETIAPGTKKLFIADIAIGHIVDGRMRVYNADTLQLLGMIGTGFAGQVYVPPAQDVVYVATSYIEKISRGKRSDWLEIYDSSTLALKQEIPIATTRAQALNYRPLMQRSLDGRWMFIQNATPATSITIVDLQAGTQTGEVPNPGCYGIFPSGKNPLQFSTMCGDGGFATYTVAADGSSAQQVSSDKIFDADEDALFIHGERFGDQWIFASFSGNLYYVDLEGATAKLTDKVTLAQDGWRPSGYQTHAVHKNGVAFVLMHPGGEEGSHKNPAEEIWAYDLAAKKLLSRSPTTTAFSVALGQDEQPVVYAINLVESKVHRYTSDPANGFALTPAGEQAAGEAPIQLETQ